MPIVIAFDPGRFESAAPYYLEGRPRYADRLIRQVADLLGLCGTQKLLDLGTGPGQLAIAFAPYAGEVTAIDPEPEMLRIAAEQAAKAGVRLNVLKGSSYTLDGSLGPFELVTIGRAFHWDALVDSYGEADSPRRIRRSPDWLPHEAVLLDSSFSQLQRIGVIERRLTPLEQLVMRALSYSITSPSRIGARVDELAEAIRATLSPHAADGMIWEIVESEALLAFSPR